MHNKIASKGLLCFTMLESFINHLTTAIPFVTSKKDHLEGGIIYKPNFMIPLDEANSEASYRAIQRNEAIVLYTSRSLEKIVVSD